MSASTAAPAEGLTPVAPGERLELIDILRGFALLGILLVNFWGGTGEGANRLDHLVNAILEIGVSSSFYPLFSFLFGLGFAMQLLRARERGTGVVTLYLRRMLALFLIGTFHAVVIWSGDILVDYAIYGVILIPLHRLPDRWLWPLAALPLVIGLWSADVRATLGRVGGAEAAEMSMLRDAENNQRTWTIGNVTQRYEVDRSASRGEAFSSALATRWAQFGNGVRWQFSRTFFLNDILAFFMIGLIIGRRRILQEAGLHRRGLALAAAGGLLAWVAGTVVERVLEPGPGFLGGLAWSVGNYGATVFYIAALALAVTGWQRAAALLRPLAAAGRIGLTNYLMQSVVMTVLFARYGMGWQEPSTTLWVLINVAFFFGIQIPFSRWWIARYRFGPAEWVWRRMTYGERQPMRLPKAEPVAVAQPVVAG